MRPRHPFPSLAIVLAAGLGLSAPAAAEPLENTYGHPTPEAACAAINRDQAAFARRQLAENDASKRAAEEAVMARQARIRQDRNAHELEKQRIAREHEQAMERWRADVAACEAGDTSRCARD
jgi:fused signal recognition particle receptor